MSWSERDAWRCFDGNVTLSEIPFMATESEQRPGRLGDGVVRHERKRMRKNTHNVKAISWIMQTSRRTVCLSNLENLNAHLVSGNLDPAERLLKLNLIAIHQMTRPTKDQVIRSAGKITGNKLGRNGETI